jgi:hypothetical protein
MRSPDGTLAKILVAYFGLVQVLHLIAIGRATVVLETSGELTFPAPPPAGGWSEQAGYFFVGVGAIDALNVIIALVFVYGFFRRARWRGWLGAVTLTVTAYSALLFPFATVPAGAWAHRPVEYAVIAVAFAPVLVLMVAFGYWLATGRLEVGADEGPGDRT